MEKSMNIKKIIQEEIKDFDWIEDVPSIEWSKDNRYVIDIRDLSAQKKRDMVNHMKDMGYMSYVNIYLSRYIYIKDDGLDWSGRNTPDPTYDRKYQLLTYDEWDLMMDVYHKSLNEGSVL